MPGGGCEERRFEDKSVVVLFFTSPGSADALGGGGRGFGPGRGFLGEMRGALRSLCPPGTERPR